MPTTPADRDPSDIDGVDIGALAVELRLACQIIARRVRFEASDAEAAPHQLSVLYKLEVSPHTPSELAELEKVSAPSMTRTLGTLVERGFAERAPHPSDGRQVIVSLTPDGAQLLTRTRARRDAWMSSRLSTLDENEIALLARATTILAEVAAR